MPKLDKEVGVADVLKFAGITKLGPKTRSEPLWKGPEEDGITYSLLSRFIACRERFRLHAIEGLRPTEGFNHRLEYGSMWHICEEEYARTGKLPSEKGYEKLITYCQHLCKKFPTQQEQIQHWYSVCRLQFPIYVSFWEKHPDTVARTPMLQEQTFNIPYELPSGRVVRLRGKMDSVELIQG